MLFNTNFRPRLDGSLRFVWRDPHLQTRSDDHESAGGTDRYFGNDDPLVVFKFSRSARNGLGISIGPIPRARIRARLQTCGHAPLPEARFPRLRSTTTAAGAADRDRSFLRFSGDARGADPCRAEKA